MRFGIGAAVVAAVVAVGSFAQRPAQARAQGQGNGLRVFFADVEGGQATLFVGPGGESLLVDAGWPGFDNRDADRIVALAKRAGISRIDNLLITHFHSDHAGGVPQLVAKIPVGRMIDHGPNRELRDPATMEASNAYQKVLADSHIPHDVAKPGDVLPIKSFKVEVVSSDGQMLAEPLAGPGAGEANPACASAPTRALGNDENDRSLGTLITFGELRILDLGDLTRPFDRELVCPVNKLGRIDVYVVPHHGLERSGSPALVKAIAPRVAIMDNGGRKGADPTTFTVIEGSSRLKDLWSLHTAEGNDAAHNAVAARTANLAGSPDAGNWLELDGRADGSFSVTNGRTGETVSYPPSK